MKEFIIKKDTSVNLVGTRDGKSDDIPVGSENWVKAQMVAWELCIMIH